MSNDKRLCGEVITLAGEDWLCDLLRGHEGEHRSSVKRRADVRRALNALHGYQAPTNEWKIKNREKLLQDIADGLGELAHSDAKLSSMNIRFLENGETVAEFSLRGALHAIVDDLHGGDADDWSNADSVSVEI